MNKIYSLSKGQQKLVEENLNLVDIILHTRIRPNETIRGMEYEELFQCGCLALCHAAATYDGSVKFATYASCVVYNALIDQCRAAQTHYKNSLSYDAPLPSDDETHEIFLVSAETVDEQLESNELEKLLTDAKNNHRGAVLKGIEAIELQLKGYSGAEIAKLYGVKNNNVTNWMSKARAVFRHEYPEYIK